MTKEVFKTILEFEDYQVSNLGNIKSLKFGKERILKPRICTNGYRYVNLWIYGFEYTRKIAELVLLTFKFLKIKYSNIQVSHLDGNKLNDNLNNLKWETASQNNFRKIEHGTNNDGIRNGMAILTEKDVIQIRKLLQQSYTQGYIAGIFSISQAEISRIKTGKTWVHI